MRDLWLCKGAVVASGVIYGAQFAVAPLMLREGGHDCADFVERRVADQIRRATGLDAAVWWEHAEDVFWSSLPASSDAGEGPSHCGHYDTNVHRDRCCVCGELTSFDVLSRCPGATAPRSGVEAPERGAR